jgi:hypothetical protein
LTKKKNWAKGTGYEARIDKKQVSIDAYVTKIRFSSSSSSSSSENRVSRLGDFSLIERVFT